VGIVCLIGLSCSGDEDCQDTSPIVYSIQELKTSVGEVNEEGNFFDNTDSTFGYVAGALKMEVDTAFFIQNNEKESSSACAQTYTIQKIEALNIVTTDTLYISGSVKLPNENVNEYFTVTKASCNSTPLSIAEYVFAQNQERCPFNDTGDFFVLQLNIAPDSSVYQAMNIELLLDNGRRFGIQTDTFKISNKE
jgi:hypothetical protein